MSETVERRLMVLLDHPTESPFGNPIPGLEELGETHQAAEFMAGGLVSLLELVGEEDRQVVVRRIGEPVQNDERLMHSLSRVGIRPGAVVTARRSQHGEIRVASHGESVELDPEVASHVFVAG